MHSKLNHLLLDKDLQIIDYDNEEVLVRPNGVDVGTPATKPDAAPSCGAPSMRRYPRREHRPPTRYDDFVALNCVEDGTSSWKKGGGCNNDGHVHAYTYFVVINTCKY